MPVPYFRLDVTEAEREAVLRVLNSGWLTTGRECLSFEQEFASQIGPGVEAVAVTSNTAGMHLVLEALGIGPGDEVIVPSLTFTATAEVVRYVGAEVTFVDVEAETLCICPKAVARAITPRTKAIMVVHYAGRAADMAALRALADRHGLHIVEDAAHSFPATSQGQPIGLSGGKAAVFSFYANKTITTGEGGMIVTTDKALASRCRVMRLHGIDRDAFQRFTGASAQWRYDIVAPGFKYNMPDLLAAVGREQLKFAEANRQKREAIAAYYTENLRNLPLILPSDAAGEKHAWHLYPVRLITNEALDRAKVEAVLQQRGIGYSVHYTPLHRMTYWKERYKLQDKHFPVSTAHGENSLSLPLFPAMRDDERAEVVDALRHAVAAA